MASNIWAINMKFTIQHMSAVTGAAVKLQLCGIVVRGETVRTLDLCL